MEIVFPEEKRKKNELQNSPLSQIALNGNFSFSLNDENDVNNEEDNSPIIINKDEGLKSGLNPEKTTQDAPIGSPEVEGFLKEVEQKLIAQVNEEDLSLKKPRNKKIDLLIEKLQKSDQVVIATDKTNSFKVIPIEKYKIWVLEDTYKNPQKKLKERNW